MDKLLDKEVHPSYKAPSLVTYLTPRHAASNTPPTSSAPSSGETSSHSRQASGHGGSQSGTRASELDEFPPADDGSDRAGQSAGGSGLGASGIGARPKTTYTLTYGQRYVLFCLN